MADQNKKPGRGPGIVVPVVDFNRCEAKGPCVPACPYDVFEIQPIKPMDREKLSWKGNLKRMVHGSRVAYVVRPDACEDCGLCVTACPEKAIKLVPVKAKGIDWENSSLFNPD